MKSSPKEAESINHFKPIQIPQTPLSCGSINRNQYVNYRKLYGQFLMVGAMKETTVLIERAPIKDDYVIAEEKSTFRCTYLHNTLIRRYVQC